MMRASRCMSAFIRWKSSSVEFWVPAARISTPSSRRAFTIDQVFTPPVKSTARCPRAAPGAARSAPGSALLLRRRAPRPRRP